MHGFQIWVKEDIFSSEYWVLWKQPNTLLNIQWEASIIINHRLNVLNLVEMMDFKIEF